MDIHFPGNGINSANYKSFIYNIRTFLTTQQDDQEHVNIMLCHTDGREIWLRMNTAADLFLTHIRFGAHPAVWKAIAPLNYINLPNLVSVERKWQPMVDNLALAAPWTNKKKGKALVYFAFVLAEAVRFMAIESAVARLYEHEHGDGDAVTRNNYKPLYTNWDNMRLYSLARIAVPIVDRYLRYAHINWNQGSTRRLRILDANNHGLDFIWVSLGDRNYRLYPEKVYPNADLINNTVDLGEDENVEWHKYSPIATSVSDYYINLPAYNRQNYSTNTFAPNPLRLYMQR
ncbi:MAG: hypothetical protein MJK04_33975 [Psychrosphaera sp.]|nr:hypothetical protein [Psychrosphaera sp.]